MLALSLLALGCRQSNPDWMGPGETASSASDDANTSDANTDEGTADDTTGGNATAGMECAAIDNRDECDMAPGCTWTGNPALGECQAS